MKNILIYGDSNTFGCNPEASYGITETAFFRFPEDVRFAGILKRELAPEYNVIEEGLPGRSAALPDPFEPYLTGTSSFTAIARSHYPVDLLIFMLGTNDLKFAPHAAHVGLAMESLLKMALNPFTWHENKIPKILLIAPVKLQDLTNTCFNGMYPLEATENSAKLGALYKQLADTYGCEFLDASDYAETSTIDALHLDPTNHRKLAEALKKKICEIL